MRTLGRAIWNGLRLLRVEREERRGKRCLESDGKVFGAWISCWKRQVLAMARLQGREGQLRAFRSCCFCVRHGARKIFVHELAWKPFDVEVYDEFVFVSLFRVFYCRLYWPTRASDKKDLHAKNSPRQRHDMASISSSRLKASVLDCTKAMRLDERRGTGT